MDRNGFGPRLRSTIFSALTGNDGDVSGQAGGDLRGMLLAAFGPGPRGGVDTRGAAKGLGVSQRTVQRWLAGEGRQRHRPRRDHLVDLSRRARQAATTQRGRRTAMTRGGARADSKSRYGAKVRIRGDQGPRRAGRDYQRDRWTRLDLDPADVEAMRAAYETGGDQGFVTWMEGHYDDRYVEGWSFGSIEELEFGDPGTRDW